MKSDERRGQAWRAGGRQFPEFHSSGDFRGREKSEAVQRQRLAGGGFFGRMANNLAICGRIGWVSDHCFQGLVRSRIFD